MTPQLEDTLVEALDLLEQGMSISDILSRYPDTSNELRPFLTTAGQLAELPTSPSIAAQRESRQRFLQRAAELADNSRSAGPLWLRRAMTTGLVLLTFSLLAILFGVFVSNQALPGDRLYSSKLLLEEVRVSYFAGQETAGSLIQAYRQERINEVAQLIALGRREPVTFRGAIEELSTDRWTVEGIEIVLDSSTTVRGQVDIGYVVQVTGITDNGFVLADHIELIDGLIPQTDPDGSASDPENLVLPTPSAIPTIRPTATVDVRGAIEPTAPIETPVPLPTATADEVPDSDGGSDAESSPDPESSQPETDGSPVSDDSNGSGSEDGDSSEDGEDGPGDGHTDKSGVDDNADESEDKEDNSDSEDDSGGHDQDGED